MRFLGRYGQPFILLAVMSTVGCKVADDAIAASQQMTATASGLRDYYRTLDAEIADTNSLYELEQATAGIPYGHGVEASQVTQDLIEANAVDPSPKLAPALKPYGLTAMPPSVALQNTLKTLALSRLQTSAAAATRSEEQASAAMLEALHEMNLRVDLLASEKPMPLRGAPWSLKHVEDWVQSWSASLI